MIKIISKSLLGLLILLTASTLFIFLLPIGLLILGLLFYDSIFNTEYTDELENRFGKLYKRIVRK